jgi:rod shape-determining protein MreB
MLQSLQPKFYVRLSPTRLSVRNTRNGATIEGSPLLAIDTRGKRKVVAIGDEATQHMNDKNILVLNPFNHPRTLISDFTSAEALLKGFVKKLLTQGSWFQLAPVIIMHPCADPEGGFTQVELRALHELCLGACASGAKGWHGRELTDHEIRTGKYPSGGELLW